MPHLYCAIDGGSGAHLLTALAGRDPYVRQVASPRHANLLIIVEPINQKLLPAVIEVAKALPRPAHALLVRTGENELDQFPGRESTSLEENLPGSRQITANSPGTVLAAVLHAGQWAELILLARSESQEETIQLPPKEEQEMATELAVLSLGPIQPFTVGPLRLFLICDGEQVVSARVESGYTYRGIAQAMMQAEWQRGLVLARALDPLAPLVCQLAYTRALEQLQGWLPPVQMTMLREAAVALERVQNVLWWGARFMRLLDDAFLTERFYGLATALDERRSLLWQEPPKIWIAPQQNLTSYGVGRSEAMNHLGQILRGVEALRKNVEQNRWLTLRTRDIGVLSAQRLHRAGVSGPVLRASERGNGDVQSRLVARLDVTVDDLERAIEVLVAREVSSAHGAEWQVSVGETSVIVQGPRGDIGLHVVSDGGERPAHIEWQRPSAALLPLLPEILAGQKLTDAETIVASLDLAMAEADG
jgi:NADH:ubiquinone oxidoreductase subunit D